MKKLLIICVYFLIALPISATERGSLESALAAPKGQKADAWSEYLNTPDGERTLLSILDIVFLSNIGKIELLKKECNQGMQGSCIKLNNMTQPKETPPAKTTSCTVLFNTVTCTDY